MPKRTLFVLVRPESTDSVDQEAHGWSENALTFAGRVVATSMAQHVAMSTLSLSSIHASDLGGARETAEIVQSICGGSLVFTTDLREMGFGFREDHPLEKGIVDDAETRKELAERIYHYLDEADLGTNSVISTHASAATFVIAWWLDMPQEALAYVNFGVQPGSVTRLVEDDLLKDRSVSRLNQRFGLAS
ncbi:MAG: histidine phosphatase family protein [Pseudomonadota bacterium]